MSGESLEEVGFIRHERLQKSPTAVDRNQLGIERKGTGKKFHSHMLKGLSMKAKRRGLFQKPAKTALHECASICFVF